MVRSLTRFLDLINLVVINLVDRKITGFSIIKGKVNIRLMELGRLRLGFHRFRGCVYFSAKSRAWLSVITDQQ